MKTIRFVSSNPHKIREATVFFASTDYEVKSVKLKLNELQTNNTEKLIRDKVLKAFEKIGRPLFVEHTGLYLESLHGFPGGLTQLFWDTTGAHTFADIFGNQSTVSATAKTTIGYCDGKKIKLFSGSIKGRIHPHPAGECLFQWDCVFVPEGYEQTFAELGDIKHTISMRKKAFESFISYLKEESE